MKKVIGTALVMLSMVSVAQAKGSSHVDDDDQVPLGFRPCFVEVAANNLVNVPLLTRIKRDDMSITYYSGKAYTEVAYQKGDKIPTLAEVNADLRKKCGYR